MKILFSILSNVDETAVRYVHPKPKKKKKNIYLYKFTTSQVGLELNGFQTKKFSFLPI